MAEKQNHKERLKEITDSIETGIMELFESDKYKSYLQTMSRFHKYSLNNTLLISMQKPDATLVAGFNKWRDGFSRFVKKGEKGIKIIAPTPYKIKEEREKLDPQTKAPILDAGGKVQTEEVEIQIPMFRVVSVFDVSQTEGEPLPTLASDLSGNVEQFDAFMEAIKRTAPVPIEIKPLPEDTDGYYHTEDKRIAIREGMSEVQTVSAAIHEVAHSLLHNREMEKELQAQQGENPKPMKPKDRNTEEVEAESISFAVCNYFGIQTAENSLGYIATWSKGKELAELRASLETINKTSSELISGIDKHFAEIVKERGLDIVAETLVPEQAPDLEQVAYQAGERYLAVRKIEGGNEFSFLTKTLILSTAVSMMTPNGLFAMLQETYCLREMHRLL
ncbi:ArdC-like ssDNA-binding domain-containing protein [Tissierella carlieri]